MVDDCWPLLQPNSSMGIRRLDYNEETEILNMAALDGFDLGMPLWDAVSPNSDTIGCYSR